jgi:hypothetical protein
VLTSSGTMVGQPAPRPDQILKLYDKLQQGTAPEPLYFSETRRQDGSDAGSTMDEWTVRDACSSNRRRSTFFFLNCMRVLWERFDWILHPLPDLRPDLEASRYSAFAYMFGFQKNPNNHRVMVSCSLVGAGVGLLCLSREVLRSDI